MPFRTPGRSVRRHLVALGTMAGGSVLVLGLILAMNTYSEPPPKPDHGEAAAFQVEKPKPKKKKEKKVERKKVEQPKTVRTAPPPPLPALGGALSGVDLGIPGLGAVTAGLDAKALVGDAKGARDLVMTESSVDVPPRPVFRRPPQFPPRARAKGTQGRVTLSLLIGQSGEVLQVRVLEADPPGLFEDAAREAVQQWRFDPAQYRGQRVKVWARQTVEFKLI